MEKILFKAMLSKMQKEILENREEIEKIYKIDKKYSEINFEIKYFIEIIEYYKNVNMKKEAEAIQVFCNGNPYIVLNLAMVAISKGLSITIDIDETMLGVNTLILKILEKILSENDINITLSIKEDTIATKAIFIDRINDYNILKKNFKEAKLIPYQSIDIYVESEEYQELFEDIYNYAISQSIDINLWNEEGIETMVKYGKARKMLLLVKQEPKIKFLGDKKVYINKNPFLDKEIIFTDKILEFLQE